MNPLLILIVIASLPLGADPPQEDAAKRTADEAAIRALVQKAADSWTKGDGDAYAALFTEDADYVTFTGTHYKGRREIARSHQQLFRKGSRLQLQIKSIRFLRPDIVLIHVAGGIVEAGQANLTPERESLQTAVMLKHGGEWHYTASQVTRVQRSPPSPPKGQPTKP